MLKARVRRVISECAAIRIQFEPQHDDIFVCLLFVCTAFSVRAFVRLTVKLYELRSVCISTPNIVDLSLVVI